MGAFRDAVRILSKRPSVIIFFGIVTFVFTLINYYNPVYTIVLGLGSSGEGNMFESLVSFMRLVVSYLSDPKTVLFGLLLVLSFLFILSLVLGFLLSGFLSILNNAMLKKPKFRGEFAAGVRRNFSVMFLMIFKTMLAGIALLIYLLVVSVPAAIITRAASLSNLQLLISAVFIDTLTLLILFFSVMFFRIYVLFWYPSALNMKKKAFLTGKHIADANFWSIVKGLIKFDITYIAVQLLLTFAGGIFGQSGTDNRNLTFLLLVLKWIFETLFFSVFTAYIFAMFKQLAGGNRKPDEPA